MASRRKTKHRVQNAESMIPDSHIYEIWNRTHNILPLCRNYNNEGSAPIPWVILPCRGPFLVDCYHFTKLGSSCPASCSDLVTGNQSTLTSNSFCLNFLVWQAKFPFSFPTSIQPISQRVSASDFFSMSTWNSKPLENRPTTSHSTNWKSMRASTMCFLLNGLPSLIITSLSSGSSTCAAGSVDCDTAIAAITANRKKKRLKKQHSTTRPTTKSQLGPQGWGPSHWHVKIEEYVGDEIGTQSTPQTWHLKNRRNEVQRNVGRPGTPHTFFLNKALRYMRNSLQGLSVARLIWTHSV